MASVRSGIADVNRDDWLDEAIRAAHGWLSFQHPDKIADAVRLISDVNLWETVGGEMGLSAKTAKTQLRAIVDRRNKIAHEADMDPTTPGGRWPIRGQIVQDATDFIEGVARAISKVA